jgi:hypothetical protein
MAILRNPILAALPECHATGHSPLPSPERGRRYPGRVGRVQNDASRANARDPHH